jgi:hypothetical protein
MPKPSQGSRRSFGRAPLAALDAAAGLVHSAALHDMETQERRVGRVGRLVVAGLALVLLATPARADLVGPEDKPCRGGKEGGPCIFESSLPGRCETVLIWGVKEKLYCYPLGEPLDAQQKACIGETPGSPCSRASGADGTCEPGEHRRVEDAGPPWNGLAEMTILQCKRTPKDTSLPPVAWAVGGGGLALVAGFVVFLRRRRALPPSDTTEP